MSQLLGDDEIDISMAFNVSFPSNEVIKEIFQNLQKVMFLI